MSDVVVPRFRVTTAPAYRPITTADMKTHLRVTGSDDDTYIESLIDRAVEHCQDVQGRAYITQTITLTLDQFPTAGYIELPRAPLASVTSVTYTPDGGSPTVFASSKYRVDTETAPGRLVLKDDDEWPSDTLIEVNGLVIVYVAGYGTNGAAHGRPASMPHSTIHALCLLVGHWYEHREATTDQASGTVEPLPIALDRLLAQHRVQVFV